MIPKVGVIGTGMIGQDHIHGEWLSAVGKTCTTWDDYPATLATDADIWAAENGALGRVRMRDRSSLDDATFEAVR
jgi:hypothetical protein